MTVPAVAVLGIVKVALVVNAPVSNWTPFTAPKVKAFVTLWLVTECCIESEFVTVTVVPGATDRLAGLYWKLVTAMVLGAGVEEEPQRNASMATARGASIRKVRIGVRGSLSFVSKDTAGPRALQR